ncbi:MAG: hypothetical protein Q8Q02_12570 [Nocardioides sp.]|nr:hypothetical protein [Nocardioides sp.]
MSKTRESRKAAERRRLARRRAEARGEPVPEWATVSGAPPPTTNLHRLGLVQVTALALARRGEHPSDAPPDVEVSPTTTMTGTEDPAPSRPYLRRDERRDALAREGTAALSRASLRSVLAAPCPVHGTPAGAPCWSSGVGLAVCGTRIRQAGYVGTPSAQHRPERRGGGRADRPARALA